MNLNLKDKVAVVTGSGRGIGKAIASRFLDEGTKVVLNDVDAEPLEQTLRELKNKGDATAKVADVSKKDQAEALIETAVKQFGKIDILVNCAGLWRDSMVHKMTEDTWDFVIKVNLYGTFFCSQAAYKHMKEANRGRIINFTSQAGIGGNVGQANYSAAKAGIIGLTKSNAKEFGRFNITVNTISPFAGGTRAQEGLPEDFVKIFLKQLAIQRWGEPGEIAGAVLFLASDEAAFITGQTLSVDGGFSIGKP
ncbi:MAG: 3-oxoacyl-ACP reductase FabG [Peptococcaceae bacterium]|nr:MAG: 3-oxoacyl-ACP reductase FabG [Peptococcaceae bacterium]